MFIVYTQQQATNFPVRKGLVILGTTRQNMEGPGDVKGAICVLMHVRAGSRERGVCRERSKECQWHYMGTNLVRRMNEVPFATVC